MHFHVKKLLVIYILLSERNTKPDEKNLLGLSVSLYLTKNEGAQRLKITKKSCFQNEGLCIFAPKPSFEKNSHASEINVIFLAK